MKVWKLIPVILSWIKILKWILKQTNKTQLYKWQHRETFCTFKFKDKSQYATIQQKLLPLTLR